MPRRRYRWVEWSDAMASHITLVEGSGPSESPSAHNERAADSRPSQLRSITDASREEEGTPVVRSESEQTNAGAGSPSTATKTRMGIMLRIRESLRRQLRNFGTHIVQTHFHESTRGIEGYYSVSMH